MKNDDLGTILVFIRNVWSTPVESFRCIRCATDSNIELSSDEIIAAIKTCLNMTFVEYVLIHNQHKVLETLHCLLMN